MGGGVAWLATRELLLAGGTAVTGGTAGLMKRSDVRRAPCHTIITSVYTCLTEDTNPYDNSTAADRREHRQPKNYLKFKSLRRPMCKQVLTLVTNTFKKLHKTLTWVDSFEKHKQWYKGDKTMNFSP